MKKTRIIIRSALLLLAMFMVTPTVHAQSYKVKKFELEKRETSSWGYGEIEKYWVKFDDGTSGYVCYSPKYKTWYIYDGLGGTWEYVDKERVIKALYIYKTKDKEISEEGRVKR